MRRILLLIIMAISVAFSQNNAPQVTNVTFKQRTDGSYKVDIYYDLYDADGDVMTVTMQVSNDAGQTWDVSCNQISGDVGDNITSGTGKHIVWDFAAEHPNVYLERVQIKIIADDHFYLPGLIDMVFVMGGTFEMGCTSEQQNYCYGNEKPVHTVRVNSFYISKYEITNAQVVEVFNWALAKGKITAISWTVKNVFGDQRELLDLDDGDCQIGFDGSQLYVENGYDNYPVIEISWYGAVAFCNYLSEKEGLTPVYDLNNWTANWNASGYRLPTEAEWEYASRGGSVGSPTLYAGSNNADDVAWYYDNSGGHTHEVGTKKPNELGIYDMSGNVWEWCWDWYASGYYSSSPQDNPKGPDSGTTRVLRGGSWDSYASKVRVAVRDSYFPNDTYYGLVGFRILRVK